MFTADVTWMITLKWRCRCPLMHRRSFVCSCCVCLSHLCLGLWLNHLPWWCRAGAVAASSCRAAWAQLVAAGVPVQQALGGIPGSAGGDTVIELPCSTLLCRAMQILDNSRMMICVVQLQA